MSQYEDELLQALAQSVMPMDRLIDSADKAAALSAALQEQPVRQREDLLAQVLLTWFKQEFFTWVSNERVTAATSPSLLSILSACLMLLNTAYQCPSCLQA